MKALQATISSIFILLILIGNSGLIISKHYCGNEVVRVSINTEAEKCHENEAQDDDCCKTKNETSKTVSKIELTDHKQLAVSITFFIAEYLNLPEANNSYYSHSNYSTGEELHPSSENRIHLINSVFLN